MPWENGEIIFQGRRAQRGFGFFGSFLGNIGRVALPLVKKIGKQVGSKILKQAVEVGKDVIFEGKRPKDALKQRGKELVKQVLTQKGSGRRALKRRAFDDDDDDEELWLPTRLRQKRPRRSRI